MKLLLSSVALLSLLSVALFAAPMSAQKAGAKKKTQAHKALLNPRIASEKAPESFKAKFETTKGSFVIEVTRDWSPLGADRFYNLVKVGFFTDVTFFRAIKGFMVQFGLHGDPKVSAAWRVATIKDEPVLQSNKPGYVTFAKTGQPNSRSTQFFINYGSNSGLDRQGFSPFGRVVEGMEVVNSLHQGYGEGAPRGRGPSQQKIGEMGTKYLRADFPKLDYIKSASIVK